MKTDLTTAMIAMVNKCEGVSQVLKALSHPVRLKVLCRVIEKERTVNDLTEFCDISQSAMSQFLNRMRAEGMVESRREGNQVYYRVANPKLIQLLRALKDIYC